MSFLLLFGRMLGAFQLAGTGAACAIDIQTVMVGIECVETAGVHEGGEILVFHLLDFAAVGANQVGVRQGDALVLGLHRLEHVPTQHLGFDEQLHGVIYSRTAHAESVNLEHLLQLLDGEMPVDVHDAVQDGITLGGLAHVVCINKLVEFFDNGVAAVSKIIDM